MLLVAIVTGASADETIYSWVSSGSSASNVTESEGTATGSFGTAASVYCMKLNDKYSALKTNNHIIITLSGTATFKEGDKITVKGCYSKGETKEVSLAILPGSFAGTSDGKGDGNQSSAAGLMRCTDTDWPDVNGGTFSTKEHTYTLGSEYEGKTAITLTRNSSGTALYFSSVIITRESSATQAPATPEFNPNGGNVNGGSTVTIASTDAQKIYYCWNNSSTAPAQDAEETWTEVSGDSYVYEIPNVTANMYLHAYGWNNYNTSSTSNTATAAFSVTKVQQPAGLAYATAAVEKYVGDANFTNALTNPNGLAVTYSVVEGATATGVDVDANGEVTVGNVAGTATIKASFAGNDNFLAGEATYTLTVVVPDPTITVSCPAVSYSAGAGNIAFTIGNPVEGGVVSATEKVEADWLTIGAVGDGTIAFTTTANNSFVSRYAVVTVNYINTVKNIATDVTVSQEPNTVGTTIIKVPVASKNSAGTVTGSIGGTAGVNLSSEKVGDGYKFGGKGHYIKMTLADDNTFQTGDIFIVHTTKAGELSNGKIAIYDGTDTKSSTVLLNTATQGGFGINAFALPAEANGKTTISIMRHDSPYNWNGYVDYVEVVRPNATISLNDGGSSFTKGFSTFCASANYTLTGATAYAATISDSKLIMTAIEGVIPANEGVVIAGDKNAEVTINYTTEAATTVTDNDLKGTTAAAKTADLKGSAAKFLAFKKSTSTFTPYGGTDFPANKAYLLLDSNNNSQSLEMVFDEATGINNVNAAETEAQAAPVKVIKNGKLYIGNYNVAGQQVK